MNKYSINNKIYYLASDVVASDPIFFKGYLTRIRTIVDAFSIGKNSHIYCNKKTGDWLPIIGMPANKDKLFLSKIWSKKNVPMLMDVIDTSLYKYKPVPPILEMTLEEQFYDEDNYYYIEMRGEREKNKCYFSASDLGDVFEIKDIESNIRYIAIEGEDYEKFIVKKEQDTSKMNIKYYLTYTGALRYIFRSQSKLARNFINWASDTLFTLHLGTVEQKVELITNTIGTDLNLFKQVMSCYTGKISCVYFISFGTVKDLKKTFNINNASDTDIVCKYGRTNDINRRITELANEYNKKNKKISVNMLTFVYIDEAFASKAEKDMADIFSSDYNKLDNIIENELVTIKEKQIGNITRLYRSLGEEYGKEYVKIKTEYEKKELINEKKLMEYEKKNLLLISENEKLKMIIENKTLELELLKCKLTKTF